MPEGITSWDVTFTGVHAAAKLFFGIIAERLLTPSHTPMFKFEKIVERGRSYDMEAGMHVLSSSLRMI